MGQQKKKRSNPQGRWMALTKEERTALAPEVRDEMLARVQAYNKKREAKNKRSLERRKLRAEEEAWAEYAAIERKAKLARAVAKLRRRNG